MNAVQRIAKNMTVLLFARIVSMLFGFFYVMYTARYLGPASFGILSFALALTDIFGVGYVKITTSNNYRAAKLSSQL